MQKIVREAVIFMLLAALGLVVGIFVYAFVTDHSANTLSPFHAHEAFAASAMPLALRRFPQPFNAHIRETIQKMTVQLKKMLTSITHTNFG